MERDWMIVSGGVRIPAPLGVYRPIGRSHGAVALLVCYGDPLQTRAIGARLATQADLHLVGPDGATTALVRPPAMRMRGAGLSGNGHRLIVWDETAPEAMALWLDERHRPAAVARAVEACRIPYDPAWLEEIEAVLREREMLIPLVGWGGAGGDDLAIREDEVCDWLVQRFGRRREAPCPTARPRARRAHAGPVGPAVREEEACATPIP